MTDATALHAQDIQQSRARKNSMDILKAGTGAAKLHPFKMVRDFLPVARGPGRLTFAEYVDYRLYDRDLYPDNDQRMRFLSDRLHWPLCYMCSDRKWDATTEDKWIAEVMLREADIQTTRTVAVTGGSARSYGKTPHFTDASEFKNFMAARTEPLFAKINGGVGSEGATRIVPLGDNRYNVAGAGDMDIDGVYSTLQSADGAYLLQEELVHHPDIRAMMGPRIATIRAVSFVINGKVHTPYTVLKIPTGENIADNFWRAGNLVADVDEQTGMIGRVVRGKGPQTEELTHHPDTGATLTGRSIPMWDKVREVIEQTGSLYVPVGYQSLDIAITADGPTVVEVNTGSSFTLPQIAKGTGFLTDEVIGLFEQAGAKIDKRKLNLN